MALTSAEEVLNMTNSVYNRIMKNHLTQEQIRSINKEFVEYLAFQSNNPKPMMKITGISETTLKNILQKSINYYSKVTS